MKKLMIITFFAFSFLSISAIETSTNKRLAEVNQKEGFLIFMQSQPVAEYEVLGTVKKTGLTWTGSPEELFNTLMKRAKKDYPKADAIIFEDIELNHATCIKFK